MKTLVAGFLLISVLAVGDALSLRRKALADEAKNEARRVAEYHRAAAKVKAAETNLKSILDPWMQECSQQGGTLTADSMGDPHCVVIPKQAPSSAGQNPAIPDSNPAAEKWRKEKPYKEKQ